MNRGGKRHRLSWIRNLGFSVLVIVVALAVIGVIADSHKSGSHAGWSGLPAMSADGRFIAFTSDASNLVPGDTNGYTDTFVRDRLTGKTVRASVGAQGKQLYASDDQPAISADGRFVAFSGAIADVYVRDLKAQTTELVSVNRTRSESDGSSSAPALSADGRFVAFMSMATDLVPGQPGWIDGTDPEMDLFVGGIFVRDRTAGVTQQVDISSQGAKANNVSLDDPAISANGRYIAFTSHASNLVLRDTNRKYDVFVHDRVTGTTERVSVSSRGEEANGRSEWPAISASGRFVAFVSSASNLVSGDTNGDSDVFVHDRTTGTTTRVSVSSHGSQANRESDDPAISSDGRYITFQSAASNLVRGDTNNRDKTERFEYLGDVTLPAGQDIFVRDRVKATTERVNVSTLGTQANDMSYQATISANGRFVAFTSEASNLVPGDEGRMGGVFVHDRKTGTTKLISVPTRR